jgi:hypothetical protein
MGKNMEIKRERIIAFRVIPTEYAKIKKIALQRAKKRKGYNLSDYCRDTIMNDVEKLDKEK